MTNMKEVYIFCDGGNRKKNGNVGAFATILKPDGLDSESLKISKLYSDVTNNQMELMGCIEGLLLIKDTQQPLKVTLTSDSSYLIKGINVYMHTWKSNGFKTYSGEEVKNLNQWLIIDKLLDVLKAKGCELEFIWVKGHSEINEESTYAQVYNVECDDILNRTMDDFLTGGRVPLDLQSTLNIITRMLNGEFNAGLNTYSGQEVYTHEYVQILKEMMDKDYPNFIKSLVSLDLETTENDFLDETYARYMNSEKADTFLDGTLVKIYDEVVQDSK